MADLQPKRNSPPNNNNNNNGLGSPAASSAESGLKRTHSVHALTASPSFTDPNRPQQLRVLFLGKREETVPVMIAVGANGPCQKVPLEWRDTNVIDVDLPIKLNNSAKAGAEGKDAEFIQASFQYSESGSAVHDMQPNVVVICYNPADGLKAVKPKLDDYSFEVRSATPRPAICLCGVEAEKLSTNTDINFNPVSASEACDLFVRTRAATYVEVSAVLAVHLGATAESIAHAGLLHAEKRPTPDLINAMRDHVVAAAFAGSKWVARRDRSTQKIFYLNRKTRKAQWDRPHDYDGIEPNLTEEEKRQQAAVEVEASERRARLEREKQMNEAYLADVHLYEERMRASEKRYEEVNEASTRNEKEVNDLRRRMTENSELLRKLQHQHDSRIKNRSHFVNSAAEKDSHLEKELQAAKERLFEIESTLALREEKEEDVHLTELAMENRKLASDVRNCLKKQLDTQKSLASNSARSSEFSRESEQLTVRLMKYKAQQQDSRKMLLKGNDDISKLRSQLSSLEAEIDQVVNAGLYDVSAQAQRQKQLYRAIAHAEKALKEARGSVRSRQVVDEHKRLQVEQRKLTSDVAAAAAAASQWELRVRRGLTTFEIVSKELEDVLHDVHSSATDLAGFIQAAASSLQLKLGGAGGGASANNNNNNNDAHSLFANRTSTTTTTMEGTIIISSSPTRTPISSAGGGKNATTPLEDKLIAMHRASLHLVRESYKDTLRRTQKVNEVAMHVANVFDDVLSVPDQSAAPAISETLSPPRRLLAKCDTAVKTDEALKHALVYSFENHLRKTVAQQQKEEQQKKNVRVNSFKRFV